MERDITFGRLLHRLRKARDLTQAALAQQSYCSLDTIKKIEIGARRPSQPMAEQLADCLALEGNERATFLATARASATDSNASIRAAAALHRIKLPHQPTPLVGRMADLAALDALFVDSTTRLVTIVGPGGMGKTRLAIALAEQLHAAERFPDQVCFVALAALDAVEYIVPALAEALDFPLDAGKQPARSARQQVFDYLRAKRILLVLDNVEHLLGRAEAGDSDAANLIADLLASAPGVAVLATSRERLRLREEHVYLLGGLSVDSEETPSSDSAVTLFTQRAQRLRPDFAPARDQLDVLARICRLVDGMPLAIELAAGWIDTLAPAAIAAEIARGLDVLATELRDLPARHRSMRAVFDSSYQRLRPAEQAALVRLAIFRGGGTLAAVQAVTQATPPQLHALIGASLLYYDAVRGRYTLHELLRQYALEQLGSGHGDEEHAAYYCAFVHQHGAALAGFDQQAVLAALEPERENVRAAWMWAAQRSRVDLLAPAADGLGYFSEWCAAFDESERMYGSAAAQLETQPTHDQTTRVLALLRAWQGNFRRLQGDIAGAEQVLRLSLALLDSLRALLDTRAERAFVLLQLGLVASEGALADARQFFAASLALYQALDRRWEASHVLLWMGDLARYQGAFAEARRHFRASLDIRSACGDRRGVAEVLIWDSHAAADSGHVDEAEALVRRSYAVYEDLGDVANRAFGLGALGVVLMYAGKYDEAGRVVQSSLDLYQDLGNRAMCAYAQGWLAVAFLATGKYQAAQILSRQALAQARELRGANSGLAWMLHYAGWVELTLGAYHDAAALLQESVALHRQSGNVGQVGWPLAQLGYTHWLLGDQRRAQAALLEVIRTVVRQRAFLPLLLALPAIALLLAEHGHPERAVELYALAWRHPVIANAQTFIDSFGRSLDAIAAALPPDIAAAAQERGQHLDLWETAAALHAELTAGGWGQGD